MMTFHVFFPAIVFHVCCCFFPPLVCYAMLVCSLQFSCRFAFPALKPPQPFQQLSATPLPAAFPSQGLQQNICAAADAWRVQAISSSSSSKAAVAAAAAMFCLLLLDPATSGVKAAPLSSWGDMCAAAAAAAASEVMLVMFDPCQLPLTPGWPLRNALLLAAARWRIRRLKVLAVRDSSAGRAVADRCYVLEVSQGVAKKWMASNMQCNT
jgi:hypothetical protein